jgi:hypothetical protein
MSESISEMTQFPGRLHPVLVHLPIGFLVLLAVLEVLAMFPRLRHVTAANRTILVLTLPVALASVGCGWLLSWSGDYDAGLLVWHKWTGTGVGIAVALLWVLHWRGCRRTYRVLLFATIVLLAVASHFGGSLTHGRDYLAVGPLRFLFGSGSEADSWKGRPPGDVMAQPAYAAVIQPIFAENCVACHGRTKSKGRLRLDSLEHLLTGGDSGPVIVPGDVAQSLLLKRVRLPLEDENQDRKSVV